MRFAPDAWFLVAPAALAAVLCLLLQRWIAAALLGLLALGLLSFFRIPRRTVPPGSGNVVAAADGRIVEVETERTDDPAAAPPLHRISTFLTLFDVHVQFVPIAGVVRRVEEHPGRRTPAFRPGIEATNQRVLTRIQIRGDPEAASREVTVRQIAGLVARRARGWLAPGQSVAAGDLLGIIRFGSRVDLLLPQEFTPRVAPGDRVRGGETVVATLTAPTSTPEIP